jgi:hypothetical protein
MAKKDAIGNNVPLFTKKSRGRNKPVHRRGSKKLGPKDPNRGDKGKH